MIRRYQRLPEEVRREIFRAAMRGLSHGEILRSMDVSSGTVRNVLGPWGGVYRAEMAWGPCAKRLSLDERVEIALGVGRAESFRSIAKRLGRSPSTISREVDANGGVGGYRPMCAHRRAYRQARRPKPTKLSSSPQLRAVVVEWLEQRWSPEQISKRLVEEFPQDLDMRISHEGIYTSLFVQGRGELRRELARCLRSGRAQRKRRGRVESRGKIPDMVMISDRPAEVEDRAVPGHWEGDLVIGKNGGSAIGTLVERATRYVMLLHLPDGREAEHVRVAMTETIQTLPAALRRTVTWDQGKELAQHAQFTIDTGVQVYFCDPHAPWQRGSNENTNGLLRQYFPKGTDLSVHTAADLQAAADSLNGRPRKTLGWKTPTERLNELLLQ